jgi:hypothetical protein
VTRCCLVVTTHERPDALGRVLDAVATQSRPPDHLIVADDGSGPATAGVVARHAARAAYPVRHEWQPHAGFRAGRIRNAAIARTRCEYVVLLDGDMVVHPDFLADHLALARPGYFSQGVRMLLDARATERMLDGAAGLPGLLSPGLGGARRAYGLQPGVLARRPARGQRLRRSDDRLGVGGQGTLRPAGKYRDPPADPAVRRGGLAPRPPAGAARQRRGQSRTLAGLRPAAANALRCGNRRPPRGLSIATYTAGAAPGRLL